MNLDPPTAVEAKANTGLNSGGEMSSRPPQWPSGKDCGMSAIVPDGGPPQKCQRGDIPAAR